MAVKRIYTVIGYTHETLKETWTTYGSYTTEAAAVREAKAIASETLTGYKFRAEREPEEYGDMANAVWVYNPMCDSVNIFTADHRQKHLHLRIVTSELRSGKD